MMHGNPAQCFGSAGFCDKTAKPQISLKFNGTWKTVLPQQRQREWWRHNSSSAAHQVMEYSHISPWRPATQIHPENTSTGGIY